MIPYSRIDFTSDDLMKMQQDAIQRVREMQKTAAERIRQTNNPINDAELFSDEKQQDFSGIQNKSTTKTISSARISDTIENIANIPKKALSSISDILENFGIDDDRLLIIILILILLSDDGDKTLILALTYLLF